MQVADIRRQFIDYFVAKGHTLVPSSSLVPGNDPTLLFVNSGMVQFKDVFLGTRPASVRARRPRSQRSVRAGGKHNDLENVGYTARHHTFFEMLGNFSFGDYFKRDAIHYRVGTADAGLQAAARQAVGHRLHRRRRSLRHLDEGDRRAGRARRAHRRQQGRASTRATTSGRWRTPGPCGPCSEIFYDHGPDVFGGPPGSPDAEGDRYIEIWNLVFMQFDRQKARTGRSP